MSVSVLPRDSVGPPSLSYSSLEERDSQDRMEPPSSQTEDLMASLVAQMKGLNFSRKPGSGASRTPGMDDVDGLLGRGVDQPEENDDFSSHYHKGSSPLDASFSLESCSQSLSPASHSLSSQMYSPGNHSLSPTSSLHSNKSPQYGSYSSLSSQDNHPSSPLPGGHLQDLQQPLASSPSLSSPWLQGCQGQQGASWGSQSQPRAMGTHTSTASSLQVSGCLGGGAYLMDNFAGGIPNLDLPTEVTHPGMSTTRMTPVCDVETKQEVFIGDRASPLGDDYNTRNGYVSVPPPCSSYQLPDLSCTPSLSLQQEMPKMTVGEIVEFLKDVGATQIYSSSSQDVETDAVVATAAAASVPTAIHNGTLSGVEPSLPPDWSPRMQEQSQVVPNAPEEVLSREGLDWLVGLRPDRPPLSVVAVSSAPHPQQSLTIPSRQPVVGRPRARGPVPTTFCWLSSGLPSAAPSAGLQGPDPLSGGVRKRLGVEEFRGPSKTPKLQFNDQFEDPEDTDLHILAMLRPQEMEQAQAFIRDFLQNCCPQQLNAYNMERQTPLHVAIVVGNVQMVSWLLTFGASTSIMSSDKNRLANEQKIEQTPLHLACEKGRLDMVNLLIDKGHADVNSTRFCDGRLTPLMVTVQMYSRELHRRREYAEIILTLMRKKASLTMTEKLNKRTALMMAVETGDQGLVSLMLEEIGAGKQARELINAPNGQGNTCLHIAAGRQQQTPQDRSSLMEVLIKFGGDNNAKNREGFTPSDLGGKAPMQMIRHRMNRAVIPNLDHIAAS